MPSSSSHLSNNSLTINNITTEDFGLYLCFDPTNTIRLHQVKVEGQVESNTITIVVILIEAVIGLTILALVMTVFVALIKIKCPKATAPKALSE